MASITLKGNPVKTVGELPAVGQKAPEFTLVRTSLQELSLAQYAGKRVVMNIFPSLDTGVCAMSVRKFNALAAGLENTVVLNISADLPFALGRFCGVEGIENAEALSSFRSSFGRDYQVEISDSPLKGLLSRSVLVLDADHVVIHAEQVPEITQEPNYDAAIAAL